MRRVAPLPLELAELGSQPVVDCRCRPGWCIFEASLPPLLQRVLLVAGYHRLDHQLVCRLQHHQQHHHHQPQQAGQQARTVVVDRLPLHRPL